MKLTKRQRELLWQCADPTVVVRWVAPMYHARACVSRVAHGQFATRTGHALYRLGLVRYDEDSDQLVATEAGKAEAGRDA